MESTHTHKMSIASIWLALVFGIASAPEPPAEAIARSVGPPFSAVSSPQSCAAVFRPLRLRGGVEDVLWEGDMKSVGGAGSVNGRPGMVVGACVSYPCFDLCLSHVYHIFYAGPA